MQLERCVLQGVKVKEKKKIENAEDWEKDKKEQSSRRQMLMIIIAFKVVKILVIKEARNQESHKWEVREKC